MKQQYNLFVRISISILAIFIFGLIIAGFLFSEPKYQISTGIITLIVVILVLFLSESFNNLSIGKLLTLSRENQKKTEENGELKKENNDLRSQIINIATSINNQSQVSFNGITPELFKYLNVVPAEKKDKENQAELNNDNISKQSTKENEQTELQKLYANFRNRSKLMQLIEPEAITTIGKVIGIDSSKLRYDVKFASAFEGLDPIMESTIIFDAYYQLEEKELFFEVTRSDYLRTDRFYYLYQMLSKLFLYRKAKNSNAELILILVELPEEIQSARGSRDIERLKAMFAPAIANKLLRIETTQYTEENVIKKLKEETTSNQ